MAGARGRHMDHAIGLSRAVSAASDPMQLTQRVVEQAHVLVAGADGAFLALWDEGDYLTYVCGAGQLAPYVGFKLHVDGSLSGIAVRTGKLVYSDDTAVDPLVDAEACSRLNVASTVCVPLMRDSKSFGVLNVSSSRPHAFTDADRLVLSNLAAFVGVVVGAAADIDRVTKALFVNFDPGQSDDAPRLRSGAREQLESRYIANVLNPELADLVSSRRRIEEALERRAFSMAFQPVVDLETGRIFGFEALSRFFDEPSRTPDQWFTEAREVGLGVELELAAVEMALGLQPRLPSDAILAVNAGPDTISTERMVRLLRDADARRLVVELTEHAEVEDYLSLVDAIAVLRNTGARLAIDDTGAGVSSLAHILKLSPELHQAGSCAHGRHRPRSGSSCFGIVACEFRRRHRGSHRGRRNRDVRRVRGASRSRDPLRTGLLLGPARTPRASGSVQT